MIQDNQDGPSDEYITESKELRRIVAETHKNVLLLHQEIQNLLGIIKDVEKTAEEIEEDLQDVE